LKSPLATRHSPFAALSAQVRAVDEDRWLASRFAPAFVRKRLIAIYAINHEIARIAETVCDATLGQIRFTWWREALEEIKQGAVPRSHPALSLYAESMAGVPLPYAPWDLLIQTRSGCDFEAEPFAEWADLEAYAEQTAGNVIRLALAACGAYDPSNGLAGQAARAWAYVGMMRSQAHWRARGRSFLPRKGGSISDLRSRTVLAHGGTRAWANTAPSAGFPAFGYVALVPGYLRALEREETQRPLLFRQLRLIAAAATGAL
jgi:15-cis-phytoene synthase